VGPEEVGLAAISFNPHVKLQNALEEVPELAARLAGASTTSKERGAPTGLLVLRRVARGRFALVGDAAGTVDPITGEGLGLAFRQADSLTDALRDADLGRYQAAHGRISRIPRLMSRLLLSMDASPWFRKRMLRALASEPQFFARLLNVHIGAETPWSFGAGNALRLGWRVLASPQSR
jgi:menaquinone-9 beta-reductase